MIDEGTFRQDLYYRISAFEIQVPPLRERRVDIPSLANHFLDKLLNYDCHRLPITIEEDALNVLASHDWHGNVRELENVVNRLVVIAAASTITSADVESVLGITTRAAELIQHQSKCTAEVSRPLRPNRAELCEDETITTYLRRVKLDLLTAAIAQYPNRTAAAQRLGLTKDALKRQLRYLRNTTAPSANISTSGLEEL
jgi:DNA-binding NtrC family response regulator